jgi:hypothetical protein
VSPLTATEVNDLTQRVEEFSQQQREQDLFEALQTEVSAIEKPTPDIVTIAHLLGGTPLGEGVRVDGTSLINCIADVRGQLENWNPRELRDSGSLKALRTSVEEFHNQLSDQVRHRWREYIDANPIPRIGDLAELLERLGIEERLILGIRNALRRLEKSAERPYPTVEEFEKYNEDLSKATEGASQIGLEGAWPLSVTSFFQQAAERGAPLELLTTEVTAWLAENRYDRYFRIVPASDQGG